MSIRKILPVAALLSLPCGAVYAQSQGWYIGAGAGQSKATNAASCSDLNGVLDPGFSCSSNDTGTGLKVFAGYQFNPYLGVEGSYVDLGKFKISASGTVALNPATADGSDKASGFGLDAVGTLPINEQFGLLARVGAFHWTLDSTASVTLGGGIPNPTTTASEKPSGTGVDFGVGAKYDFNSVAGLRVEWQRFKSIGNDDTGKSDVDLISASLLYRFK